MKLSKDVRGLSGDELTLSYGRREVVRGASLTLEPGTVTALIGPNGSGKSTLLRSLVKLHHPSAGRVTFDDGTDAAALSARDFAQHITLLAQSRPEASGLSVRDIVEFGRHPYRRAFSSRDPEGARAIEHALHVTGTTELADRSIEQLSGGQLQRVWLASCLAQDTGILLLDEPTTYLDLRYQVEILDLVRELADDHGVTIGVVLHDLDQAAAIADHVVLLCDGVVVADGTPAEVFTAPLLSAAYGIPIVVDADPSTGGLRSRAIGRHNSPTESHAEKL